MVDPKTLCQQLRLLLKGPCTAFVLSCHAAIDSERQAGQRIAEQRALDMRQRQHARDAALIVRVKKVRVVAEHVPHEMLPATAVEEGGVERCLDEGVP